MAVEVRMPQLGESVHEGTVGKWLKVEGDPVTKYEPILEVITDKVDTEVTAADAGTLLKILVPEGTTVTVGTVLALIGQAGEVVAAAAAAAPAPARSDAGDEGRQGTSGGAAQEAAAAAAPRDGAPAARVSPVAARMAAEHGIDAGSLAGSGPGGKVKRGDVARAVAEAAVAAPGTAASGQPPRDDIGFISPRVARLAAQHGVDLRQVAGSGRDGRITARDVEDFVAAAGAAGAAPASAGASVAAPPTTPAARAAAPATPATPAAEPLATRATGSPTIVGELIELTPMRRAIADHMVRSKQTSPHVSTIHEADMAAVLAAHRALKDEYAARGDRLTVTALIVSAVARAIAAHPVVNSSWTDEGIRLHRDVNIGLAVAIPGGLIVPVIKNADEKSLVGLSRDINDLAERARSRRLVPDDVQGGTFTITNYGTLGSLFGTPVINQPQAAILGTGAIKKRVVVVEGPEGDQIAIRPMMYVALTFDHRILDGGSADPFMRTLIELLERYEA